MRDGVCQAAVGGEERRVRCEGSEGRVLRHAQEQSTDSLDTMEQEGVGVKIYL